MGSLFLGSKNKVTTSLAPNNIKKTPCYFPINYVPNL